MTGLRRGITSRLTACVSCIFSLPIAILKTLSQCELGMFQAGKILWIFQIETGSVGKGNAADGLVYESVNSFELRRLRVWKVTHLEPDPGGSQKGASENPWARKSEKKTFECDFGNIIFFLDGHNSVIITTIAKPG